MKGEFTYNNKTFRWRFRIRKYMNPDYGYTQIYYKYKPIQIFGDFIEGDEQSSYDNLVNRFYKMTDEEIEDMIKSKIISDYGFSLKESKFK